MRLVTWNCNGAFRRKSGLVASLNPPVDVAVICECEQRVTTENIAGDRQPTAKHWFGTPVPRAKGLGVFSYTGAQIQPVRDDDPLLWFSRLTVQGPVPFQVAGVWTVWLKEKARSYRQAHEGLERHRDWIASAPTVMMGDFNNSLKYSKGVPWRDLMARLEPLGLVSAYHYVTGEAFGEETKRTHYFRKTTSSTWHIDYAFVPKEWAPRITKVEVGAYEDWKAYSDHMPLIVDLDGPV